MGDSGFTFNHKKNPDEKQIIGYTPKKRPPKGQLSLEDQIYNKSLSRVRAVIENVIGRFKKSRVLKGVYRHFSLTHSSKIPMDLVVSVVSKLTARELKHSPPRSKDWTTSTKDQIQK
jgi:hypothetical protein